MKDLPVMTPFQLLVFPFVLGLSYLAIQRLVAGLRSVIKGESNLFPSPPSDPLIGHARIFPQEYPWKTFAEWGKRYGKQAQLYHKEMITVFHVIKLLQGTLFTHMSSVDQY